MNYRIFRFTTTCLLILSSLYTKAERLEYTDSNNINYLYDIDGGVASVEGGKLGSAKPNGNVVIPNQIIVDGKEYAVTRISDEAFKECDQITSVTVSDGITYIGKRAFQFCKKITKVTLPESISYIGERAFSWCENLASINIPQQITHINKRVFESCYKLNVIIFPSNLITIGEGAFVGCTSLKSLTIPKSVRNIVIADYTGPFQGCMSLEKIEVEQGNAFYDSRNNCNAIIETATNTLMVACKNTIIPKSVTSLARGSFAGVPLAEITIPSNIKKIADRAFVGCDSLKKISLPEDLTIIEECCFYECSNLQEISMPQSLTTIGNYAFKYCYSLQSVKIPENVKEIGIDAFSNCPKLEQVALPEGLFTISEGAFSWCVKLKSIEFPSTLKVIGKSAFSHDESITSIIIPSGVTHIGASAFLNTHLDTITSLIKEPFEVNESAFMTQDWITGNYATIFSTATLYVPKGTKEKYKATAAWNQFHPILEEGNEAGEFIDSNNVIYLYETDWPIATVKGGTASQAGSPDAKGDIRILDQFEVNGKTFFVKEIGSHAFKKCNEVTSIYIPSCIEKVGDYAFAECKKLHTISFADCTLTELGKRCFDRSTNLTSVELPHSLTSISYGCFYRCESIKNISIPNSVSNIDDQAFVGCCGLTNIVLPNQLTRIGDKAFMYCTRLKSIFIPKSVTLFESDRFFTGCWNLESFAVEEGNPVYDSRDNCNGLIHSATNKLIWGYNKTIIPNSVTSIGDGAFCECQNLTSVVIPPQIQDIGYCAYYGCTGVTTIILPENHPDFGLSVFGELPYLENIISKSKNPKNIYDVFGDQTFTSAKLYIPKGARETYENTSEWGRFQNTVEIEDFSHFGMYTRKVVVEEGSGTWCQWCPRGIVGMSKMLEKYPYTFIPIVIHVDDEMAIDSYDPLISQKFVSFPTCIMNRRQIFDPNLELLNNYYNVGASLTPADIRISATWLNDDKTELQIHTTTRFAYDMPDDYRIAYVICENQVGPYNQKNAYAYGQNGEMGGFENEDNYVSILHNHVARFISKVNGSKGTVPESPVANEDYKYNYTISIPGNIQNIDNIELIVLLINQETMEIDNADKITADKIRIYDPDLVEDIIQSETNKQVWYTLDGRQIPTRPHKKGIYVSNGKICIVK